ncbi:MAG: ATP-dependent helicase [Phycisphaerales bacterium]
MTEPRMELLEGLTEAQRSAVTHTEGPLLVLAAAGSGKTRVITRRIAYLVSLGVPAWSILAVTFTNKAAGEMRERVRAILGDDPRVMRGMTVSTFHALGARLLRRFADRAGLAPDFAIYDASDQQSLCKRVIADVGLSTSNFPPRAVLSAISTAKNALQDENAYAARATDFSSKNIAKVYKAYAAALRKAGAVDFDDLLLKTAMMLKNDREAREEIGRRWSYLLIDEYQDTNAAQFEIAAAIAEAGASEGRTPNICVVGDPDQAIYGWRGADISNILEFERHFPGTRVVTLGENFRSTAPILAAADTLIRNNKRRKHKDLFTTRPGGERIECVLCRDERHEASLVVDWLKARRDVGDGESVLPWNEMAVFYRTNALSRVLEDALRTEGVPYTIARGTAFYEREEVKSALAYLRVLANQADDVSLLRIVNTPARGIGDAAMKHVQQFAGEQQTTLFEAMRRAREVAALSTRAASGVEKFVAMVDSWTGNGTFFAEEAGTGESAGSLGDLVERVVQESGLMAMYKAQAAASKSDADEQRLDNLDELIGSAREFEDSYDPADDPAFFEALLVEPVERDGVENAGASTNSTPPLLAMLRAYLERVALVADADAVDPSQGSVTLMTLHAAKGLEFACVAMVGLEEGTLPHSRAFESEAELEEERRLCFVGITRARRRLHITSAKYRAVRGFAERTIPSRFLSELPREHVTFSDQSDAFDDLEQSGWFDGVPTRKAGVGGGSGGSGPGRTGSTGTSRSTSGARRSAGGVSVGSKVSHPQFGVGVVKSVSGGAQARAVIEFKGVGMKTLVLEYARLTVVS